MRHHRIRAAEAHYPDSLASNVQAMCFEGWP
jgi:hypothetical protein